MLLVLTANRGLCGGYNSSVLRLAYRACTNADAGSARRSASKCPASAASRRFKFRKIMPDQTFTHFEDRPAFDEVEVLANRYLDEYITGKLDRLDVVYTKFVVQFQAGSGRAKRCCR